MLFNSKDFRAMENGMQAAWLQMQTANHNLANLETPNYKAKAVVFEDVLNRTMQENGNAPYSFQTRMVTREGTTVRPDGNNVDSDTESLVLYKAYAQYSYLTSKVNNSFSNFRYVLNNAMK